MTMTVQSGIPLTDVDVFCKKASRLVLSQIVDKVTVKERLTVNGDARRTEFFIDIIFFPREEYEARSLRCRAVRDPRGLWYPVSAYIEKGDPSRHEETGS